MLDHGLFIGVHEGAGHAGVEAPGGPAEEPSGLTQGPAKLASCLLRETLYVGEACAKAARGRPGHAELLPETALKGPNAAPEGLSSRSKASAKAARCALSACNLLAEAGLKGTDAALEGARGAPKACT